MEITNNSITVSGEVLDTPVFNHEIYGEGFYVFTLGSMRSSGNVDELPICVSERLVDLDTIVPGAIIKVEGQVRTFNKRNEQNNKAHLVINVFAKEVEFIDEADRDDSNEVELHGFICKKPNYRTTPLDREICDMLVAVNRPYGKSDYIPCIAWGRNAGWANTLEVGTKLRLKGRLQSRKHQKKISENPDGTAIGEERTAYELSVGKLELED